MNRLYLVPVETINGTNAPKYFRWKFNLAGIAVYFRCMYYGFLPSILLYALDISQVDHNNLASYTDVYCFPENLDTSVSDYQTIRPFFEAINIPADWLTASSTYRELLRMIAGLFQFSQRYYGISNEALITGAQTMDTRYRDLSAQQQTWFNQTLESFGYPSSIIQPNRTMRQMCKAAADAWTAPFYLGEFEF